MGTGRWRGQPGPLLWGSESWTEEVLGLFYPVGGPEPAMSTCFQNPVSCPIPALSRASLTSSPDIFPGCQAQAHPDRCQVSLNPTQGPLWAPGWPEPIYPQYA